MADRSVSVKLDLIVAPFQAAAARAAKAVRDFTGQSEKDLDRLGASMQRIGTKMTLSITAAFGILAREAVGFATDATEAMNMAGVVFGRNLAEVEKWAEGSARNFGLTRAEAVQAAATFTNMTQSMGLAAGPARQMGMNLVQLAADIGSFRNVDPADMLEKLRSGITGEIEPMKALGIILNETTVKQEAMRLGLVSASGELSEAAKVQARYSLIVKQTQNDLGDFARTSKEGANAGRVAAAEYRQAMTEFGEALLPLKTKAAVTFADVAEAMASLPPAAQQAIVGFGGLAAAAGPTLIVLGSVVRNLKDIQEAAPRMGSALGVAGKGLLAIGGTVGALFAVKAALDAVGLSARGLEVDVQAAARATTDELVDGFQKLEGFDSGAALEMFRTVAEDSIGTATRLRDALAATGADVSDLDSILRGAADAEQRAASDASATADAFGETGEAAGGASGEVDKYRQALDELLGKSFDAEKAQNDQTTAIAEWADSVRAAQIEGDKFATSLSDQNVQGLKNRQTLMDLVAGAFDVAAAMDAQGASAADVAMEMASQRAVLIEVATQLGFTRDEAARYIDVLLQVPGQVGTVVFVDTRQAMDAINRLGAAMNNLLDTFSGSSIPWISSIAGDLRRFVPVAGQAPAIPGAVQNAVGGGGPQASRARTGGGGGAKGPSPDDLQREADQRMRARFDYRDISLDEYVRYLDGRIAAEEKFTDDWAQLMREREQVLEEHADAVDLWNRTIVENEQKRQDIMAREGRLSNDEYRRILLDRHEETRRVHGYWSEEAERIRDEIRAIDEQMVDDARDAAEEERKALEERVKARDEAFDRLNTLLDDEQRIRQQMADAETQFRQRMADVAARYEHDQQAAIDTRRQQLLEWVGIEERAQYRVGSSVRAMARNVHDQTRAFTEWQDQLARVRARGVSDALISMLGLDEDPRSLVQLRMFARATDAEIADLNAAVAAQQAQAGQQVQREQTSSFSTISSTLRGLAERHAAEVEQMTEEFLAQQRALGDDLAALGQDQGRSFADAIAAGLRSGIPAIAAAARAAQEALTGTGGGGVAGPPAGATFAFGKIVNGVPQPGSYWTMPDGSLRKFHRGTGSVPGPYGSEVPAVLQAGERVFSLADNARLVAAVRNPQLDYDRLAAAVAGAAGGSGGGVQFLGDVVLRDGVDVDLLARRLAFTQTPGGF